MQGNFPIKLLFEAPTEMEFFLCRKKWISLQQFDYVNIKKRQI
jgi:hypothetical protein